MESGALMYRVLRMVDKWHRDIILLLWWISVALRACTHYWLRCWERHLVHLRLSDLCPSINNTTNKSNNDSCNASECNGRREEDKTTDSDREFVESSDHGVRSRRCDADTPSGAVGYEYCCKSRVNETDHQTVSRFNREICGNICAGPILEDKRADKQNRDGQEVVIEHGWEN